MNLKSEILKLSIIFLLILVLIPVATAMDCNDTFTQEYDCSEDEGFVIEYEDVEVSDTQSEVSSNEIESSVDNHAETSNDYHESDNIDDYQYTPVQEEDAHIEYIVYSSEVTHDVESCDINEEESYALPQKIDEITYDNIHEHSEDDLTLEEISVNIQGSFFISKSDISVNYHQFNGILSNGIDTLTSPLNRNIVKVLELKNNLLINTWVTSTANCCKITDLDYVPVATVSKITSDYAYSIDNSVVGSDNALLFISCFLNNYPCFDAIFCCDLFFEYFFGGGVMFAAEIFCPDCFVEYSNQYLINLNDYILFNRFESVNGF